MLSLLRLWFCDALQINEALKPTSLEIYNDSHLHAHHKAMEGSTSKEVCALSFPTVTTKNTSFITPCCFLVFGVDVPHASVAQLC